METWNEIVRSLKFVEIKTNFCICSFNEDLETLNESIATISNLHEQNWRAKLTWTIFEALVTI